VGMLKKAYGLLRQEGVLLLTTPCADSAFNSGIKYFGHWNGAGNLVYFSLPKLLDECKKIGYNVVMARENYGQRFLNWNTMHVILQREKEEDPYIPEVKDGEVDESSTNEQSINESERAGGVESNGIIGQEPNGMGLHK